MDLMTFFIKKFVTKFEKKIIATEEIQNYEKFVNLSPYWVSTEEIYKKSKNMKNLSILST